MHAGAHGGQGQVLGPLELRLQVSAPAPLAGAPSALNAEPLVSPRTAIQEPSPLSLPESWDDRPIAQALPMLPAEW